MYYLLHFNIYPIFINIINNCCICYKMFFIHNTYLISILFVGYTIIIIVHIIHPICSIFVGCMYNDQAFISQLECQYYRLGFGKIVWEYHLYQLDLGKISVEMMQSTGVLTDTLTPSSN